MLVDLDVLGRIAKIDKWNEYSLGEIADPRIKWSFTGGPFGSNLTTKDYESTGVRIIQLQNIGDGQFNNDYAIYTSGKKAHELISCVIYPDEIILSKMGDPVARACIIPNYDEKYLMASDGIRLSVDSRNFDTNFVLYMINFKDFRNKAIEASTGTTRQRISLVTLRSLTISAPPLPEQRAIAEALGDADALIESLEQLIAKKRAIKQGTMQQLLTGNRRLPGFSGEWEVKNLEDLVDCLDTLRIPLNESQRMKMPGDYPYCGANGILDYVNSYVIDDDIILIAEDGGYFDEYSTRPIAYRMSGKCWVNNHAHILKAKDTFCQDFIFFSLVHKNITQFLASGTRSKLNKGELIKIEIDIPFAKDEQTAIAEVLNDMDAEIDALEAKLAKTRQLKQGMMQQLLTGRIRLL